MIFWNFETPITLFGCVVWNCSEYFNISLGQYASMFFEMALGKSGQKK